MSKRSKAAPPDLYLDTTLEQLGKNDSRTCTKNQVMKMKDPFPRSRPQETRQVELEDLTICKGFNQQELKIIQGCLPRLGLLRYGFPQCSTICCLASFCSCPPTPGIFSGVSPSRFSCKKKERGRRGIPQPSTAPWR
jgi:hypothetical protein